jgi:formimidoylglutamate deiminase
MPDVRPTALWAPRAWLADSAGRASWREHVLLRIGGDGCWSEIRAGVAEPAADVQILAGPLLPGLVNAHSHAFQRAFAGLAERRESASDDFWSWRDSMYRVALQITPDELRAVAAQLYVELLEGGYTHVCEFHYLQRDRDGSAYADPLELSWALADAAAEAGIGLTVLPVLYERAGFAQPALRDDQRRFAARAADVWRIAKAVAACGRPRVNAGLAVHSLRAAAPESIAELRRLAEGFAGPIHAHVAEQTGEVDDCIKATGARPIEWLARQNMLDARWHLVHATHTVAEEIEDVARSGAAVVICPTTEANLGDGLCDLPGWLAAGVPISIGSDSHVSRDALEELRWLEYGQRLALRRRNVAAAPQADVPSTAGRLFTGAVDAGAAAAGQRSWGLRVGARADALVADTAEASPLLGVPPERLLDALVFSSPGRPWRDVLVAGRWVIREHGHPVRDRIARRFEDAMHSIRDAR